MKNGFVLILLLVIVILACVLVQFYRTRRTMAEFAGQHDLTYTKSRWNLFDIGTIQGSIGGAGFFMGALSLKYKFGPVASENYPDEKSILMYMTVKGMPENMVIRRRGRGMQGDAVEMVLSQTGYSVIKTGDGDFDARFDVVATENNVTGWLTDSRRKILKAFLSREKCAVADGRLKIELTRSLISRNDLESAFAHIRESQVPLSGPDGS